MSRKYFLAKSQAGFTIVELMVATLVFSMVLLIITAGVIALTNQYYKGITSSNTQSVARSIMDTIAQDIQFSDSSKVTPTQAGTGAVSGYFCTGSRQYTFKLGQQLADAPASGQTAHALIQSSLSGNCPAPVNKFPLASADNPHELITPGMRLANLSVQPGGTATSWKITVRIVSGDDDLLSNPSGTKPLCHGGSGAQFCAVSELTTTVESRL